VAGTAAGADGWVAGEFLAAGPGGVTPPPVAGFPANSYVFVNTAKLNVRASATTAASVLTTLKEGDIAQVGAGTPIDTDGYTWYPVTVDANPADINGWVAGEFLIGGVSVGANAIVADGPLNLRATASKSGTVLAVLAQGATVSVLSGPVSGGGLFWFEVNDGTNTGFVAGQYLGPAPAP
jgi:uncharacterized protein YgiM (DUF1202 family)